MSGVGVLDKAVVILAACVDGASLAELVERTKLPRATAQVAGGVDLCRRLGEGEVAGPQPDPEVRAKEAADEVEQRSLEIGERDARVHEQPLHLGEHRRVRGVVVPAKDVPGGDDPNGRRPGEHRGVPLGNAGLWIALLIFFLARGLLQAWRYPALVRTTFA